MEELIRAHLDGTFTVLTHFGETKTKKVAPDYVPSHHSRYWNPIEGVKGPRTSFSPEEDKLILALKKNGCGCTYIGNRIGRDRASVWTRIKFLARK